MTTSTPEEARTQIVNMVREFVRRDVEPVAAQLDRDDETPHELINTMKELGLYALLELLAFVLILGLGWAYAWRKGALEWE